MWLGFKSRRRRHMWVEFVVGSLLCSKRFFSGYSGFPLSSKTNISKFQFDRESCGRRTTMWMCYLQIVIYLFIYFIWLVDCWLVNCLHDPSFFRWNLLPRSLCAGHRQRKANRNYGCLTPGSRPKLWIKPAMRSTWIGRGGIPLKNNLNTISQVLKDVGQFFSTCIFVSLIC